eukprot:c6293_g1_i1.p1 GENE.c6293_g1_i1~~c6293_g1_i1.p1  ORF type:complete len:540 (-),score=96.94 c6293_g1_i1:310-1929(-)
MVQELDDVLIHIQSSIQGFICRFVADPPPWMMRRKVLAHFIDASVKEQQAWVHLSVQPSEFATKIQNCLLASAELHHLLFNDPIASFYDRVLVQRINLITNKVSPVHLDIPTTLCGDFPWTQAQKALVRLGSSDCPNDKLDCMVACCEEIQKSISSGADQFLPVLIYVVIAANIPTLHQDICFSQRYATTLARDDKSGYCLTSLLTACRFITRLRAKNLSMSAEEFESLGIPPPCVLVDASGKQFPCPLRECEICGSGDMAESKREWKNPVFPTSPTKNNQISTQPNIGGEDFHQRMMCEIGDDPKLSKACGCATITRLTSIWENIHNENREPKWWIVWAKQFSISSLSQTTKDDRDQPDNSIPVLQGFLRKRGRLNTAYQQRWCILQHQTLYYYSSAPVTSKIKPRGSIPLANCYVTQTQEGFNIHSKDRVYFFTPPTIIPRSQSYTNFLRDHVAMTRTATDKDSLSTPTREDWIRAITSMTNMVRLPIVLSVAATDKDIPGTPASRTRSGAGSDASEDASDKSTTTNSDGQKGDASD